MLPARVVGVFLTLLASACFSPQGGGTSPGSESDPGTATGATTGDSGTSTSLDPTATTTSTTGPTTGGSTTTPVDPTTGTTGTTTTSGPTSATTTGTTGTTGPGTDATSDDSSTTDAPAVCGDGIHVQGEECDDGNDINDDACSNNCTLAVCGDSILHADEECDEPGPNCEKCLRVWMQVFVTSAEVSSDLNGLGGADDTCQQFADGAGVQGRFKAWLSVNNLPAHARLIHSTREYRRLDDELVANSWSDLIDMNLAKPINVDETGALVAAQSGCGVCPVWTATLTNGGAYMDSCNLWNFPAAFDHARVGECTFANAQWTDGCGTLPCDKTARLYCLEQGLTP